ncbi:MAG: hypothetical protein LBT20_01440, partial [Clostridiales bacterium]|nr:hypothetical protein [Clostridiales bacterium]
MVGQIILYTLLGLLLLFLIVTITRTVLTKPRADAVTPLKPYGLDKDKIAAHLSGAVKIPTVSMVDS